MIDFEHVSKQYKHNAKPALEDVNFHVDDGEFVFCWVTQARANPPCSS